MCIAPERRLTVTSGPQPVSPTREKRVVERPTTGVRSLSAMLRHIDGVLAGDEAARQLAVEVSAPTATIVAALQKACRPGRH